MGQIFAYITYKEGVADDSALELAAAAKRIDAGAAVTAIVTGSGASLDTVCNDMAASFNEVWKIDNEALAYPNAEVIRGVIAGIVPADAIVLLPHDTFGMDLGPGLSIKLDSAFTADVVDIEGVDGAALKLIRQEFGGVVSTHVDCDSAAGAVLNIRPGAVAADESKAAGGQVVDKSGDAGDFSAGRKYLEIVAAEAGDVDITKEDVLVSIGRGIEDEENIEIAQELADAMGAVVS